MRLLLTGCRQWQTKLWITLDNQAVVDDLNRSISSRGQVHKLDDTDIWPSVNDCIKDRAARDAIRVTWTKGHATQDDLDQGRSTEEERQRNAAADELATDAINRSPSDRVLFKATRQTKLLTALQ